MTHIGCIEYAEKDLFGAIVGLARSVEGNKNRPTESTHNALLLGLRMLISHNEYTYMEIKNHIEVLHTEKFKLVNRCLTCINPCGRNDDYDVARLDDLKSELKELKYTLLSSIMSMEPILRHMTADKCCYEETIMFLYDALFIMGSECDRKEIYHLLMNSGKIYQKLFNEYLNSVDFLEKYYNDPAAIAVSTCMDGEPCIKCGLCSSI